MIESPEEQEKREIEHAVAQSGEQQGKKVPIHLMQLADKRRKICTGCGRLYKGGRSKNPAELSVSCGPGGKGCVGYSLITETNKCPFWGEGI